MTNWQRFDDVWINVDHVEVVRVDEQEEGGWQLTAAFASGRSYPLGSHEDRQLLLDCTDVVLRGEVGERLRALADPLAGTVVTADAGPEEQPARRRWWQRRVATAITSGAIEGPPQSEPLPAG